MAKRLGKDQRAAFIEEFERDGKITSDPNYYAIKDKNGKTQIRRVRPKKESSSDDSANHAPVDSGSVEEPQPVKEPKEKTL